MTTIKEIPLLFQTEMVQAILAGRKTQTRRTKGLEDVPLQNFDAIEYMPDHWGKKPWVFSHKIQSNPDRFEIKAGVKSIYGKPGDLLWVRETWFNTLRHKSALMFEYSPDWIYRAEGSTIGCHSWKPSIHMPKYACRIWLMVEEIRVERLQEITEEDAVAEGVEKSTSKGYCRMFSRYENTMFRYYLPEKVEGVSTLVLDAKGSFESLWKHINGRDSWNANPWVWVVKFRVLSTTGRPTDDIILQHHKAITGAATADLPSSVSGLPSPITP